MQGVAAVPLKAAPVAGEGWVGYVPILAASNCNKDPLQRL